MSKSILNEVNASNWKELAVEVANELYPLGSIVTGCGRGEGFGKVSSISDTGKIIAKCGKLPLVEVTDNTPVYGKFWYNADIKLFVPNKKEDIVFSSDKLSRRFTPMYFIDYWKKHNYKSPIRWESHSDFYLILGKPNVNEKGLILYEHQSP